MLKYKDLKKKFTIIYETEDMTENHIIDGKVLSEEERDLVYLGDFNKGDIFILSSDMDIREWDEMMDIVDEEEWNESSEEYGLSNYFEFV